MDRINRGNEVHGLHKVPDKALIQGLKIEAGKRESYILELEDNIQKLEKQNRIFESTIISERHRNKIRLKKQLESIYNGDPKQLREIRKDKICAEYKAGITILNRKIALLKDDKNSLIAKLHRKYEKNEE